LPAAPAPAVARVVTAAPASPATVPANSADPTLRLPTLNTTPFQRGADYALKRRDGGFKLTPFSRGFPYTRFAPDGTTALLASGRAAELRVGAGRGVALHDTSAARSAFSPDLKRLATSDEDGTLAIWSVPSGQEELRLGAAFKTFGGAGSGKYVSYELAFADAEHVLYHTGCRLRRLDLASEQSESLGPADLCGYVSVSANGKRWVVADERFVQGCGLGHCYARAVSLDPVTGLGTEFVRGPFTDLRLSPAGSRLCFARRGQQLSCVDIEHAREEYVTSDPVERWYDFDEAEQRLFFATRAENGQKLLFVADFRTRTQRFIARLPAGADKWYALAPDRVLVEGHDGATLYDLEQGFWLQLMPRGSEVEGFAAIPGSTRFILGRAGGPRSYVELTP
jgi:hypothetical protein